MVEQEPDEKGIRPTRFCIVRSTHSQLRETFLADCESYIGEFFTYKVSRAAMEFRFSLPDGTTIHSDWLLMSLERPEDQKKLLSLNLSGSLIEECRETPYALTAALMGRIGRYPAATRVLPTWQGIMMITNPWSEGSDFHTHFVVDKPDDWLLVKMPGGLDANAENTQYLPKDYYQRLLAGHSDEWIKVHVHGMWGDDVGGQSVYRASFKSGVHLTSDIPVNPMRPILIGIDFGRTPACVFTQEDMHGRVLVLRELTSEDMGLAQFCESLLVPTINEHYYQNRIFVVGDPAGVAKSQYSETNAYDVLKANGLECIPAPTNNPVERLSAVEKLLISTRAGDPGFLIEESECPTLVRGFLRDYRFKKKRDGALMPAPDKNDASHVHDALQYACLGHQSHYVGRRVMRATAQITMPRRQRPSSLGWT